MNNDQISLNKMVGKSLASLANQVGNLQKPSAISTDMNWYVLPAAVGGITLAAIVTAVIIFKFIQKRRQAMSDPESRLSAAYRDGFLREDSGPKWRTESLKISDRSQNNSTKKDATIAETSLIEDKQQSRRLINQDGTAGCKGNTGYGGMVKESKLWSDSRRGSEINQRGSSDSRLNSPRESKIEIETRGEKSYPTIIERIDLSPDSEDLNNRKTSERGFIEKCYEEYKCKKDKLTDDNDRCDSKVDVNSESCDKLNESSNLGKLYFEVRYDNERLVLSVSIVKAQGLRVGDEILGNCDPYVKLQLLPDKKLKVKTRLVRKNQNPTFDEQFDFYNIEPEHVEKVILHFCVYCFDRFSRDHVIGEVRYSLADAVGRSWVDCENNKNDEDKEEEMMDKEVKMIEDARDKSFFFKLCQDLMPQTYMVGDKTRGEILLSLCYNPGNCQLVIIILKARNLPLTEDPEIIDSYVKIYLKFDGQRLAKKRTSSKPSGSNPVFNETFTFQLPRTPSELTAMLAWNRYNPLANSASLTTSLTKKFNLPCRLQGQMCPDNNRVNIDSEEKSRSSLFRRFSICSSTLLDKPNSPVFIPKSPTFCKNSFHKRPSHILDRFSLSVILLDEEQEVNMDYIGRVELGNGADQEFGASSVDLINTAADHWREIIANLQHGHRYNSSYLCCCFCFFAGLN